jgi:hypothetical protein
MKEQVKKSTEFFTGEWENPGILALCLLVSALL